MQITETRVNHVVNPVGYLMEGMTTFTWKVEEAEGKFQKAARIVVASDPKMQNVLSDTGFRADLDSLGSQVPVMLLPRTRYYWTVTVQTDAGEEATSEVSFFETGKMAEPWEAKWIGCDMSTERHPIFHGTFTEEDGKRAASARLYICGLGLYHAQINGKPVGQEYLTPYCTDYNKWIEYQTYDITDLLERENQIDVTLGVGWYLGRFGFSSQPGDKCIQPYYGDGRFKLLAEIRVTYADGSEQVYGTDDSWTVTRSNITFSNIYDGEHRDDTLEEVEPVLAEILGDADSLPVTERLSLPVERHEVLHPVELLHTPAGEEVFDLGQNFAGIFRLKVQEPKGTKIHVQVGEVLQQGNFYRDNLRTAKAEYWYISDGEEHVLEPQFTFYGYRYAKVEGVHDLTIDSFEGIAVYSDITPAGKWESGDAKLNKLMQNIGWGQKSNFVDVPTDCPQRDERMGWTADTQVFVPTASYLTDSWAFYRKFLHDLALDQSENDGLVPNVIPDFGIHDAAAVWGDAATFIPWNLYKWYGDKTVLGQQMESMKDWVDWIEKQDEENHGWGKMFQLGDWLALDNPNGGKDQVMGGTDTAYIAYVYYMTSARIVAKSARVLKLDDVAAEYNAKADKIRAYIENEFFTPNGRCAVTTMTGYILALYYDLTAERDKTIQQLVQLIKDAGNKFKTGFVGTPMVSRVLSSMGEDKLAYKIIHNEEYPGWLYEINLGATTVWERWNSMEADGTVSSTAMNSFNHYAYGSIGQWMWESMAGIAPDENVPGFRHAILRPVPDAKTGYVHASYDSPAGTYSVEWDVIDDTHVHVKVSVPFNCTATLLLPYADEKEAKRELESGTCDFTYELTEPLVKHFTVDSPLGEIMAEPEVLKTLIAKIPMLSQITQLPPTMYDLSMRQLMVQYAPDGNADAVAPMLDGINQLLAAC